MRHLIIVICLLTLLLFELNAQTIKVTSSRLRINTEVAYLMTRPKFEKDADASDGFFQSSEQHLESGYSGGFNGQFFLNKKKRGLSLCFGVNYMHHKYVFSENTYDIITQTGGIYSYDVKIKSLGLPVYIKMSAATGNKKNLRVGVIFGTYNTLTLSSKYLNNANTYRDFTDYTNKFNYSLITGLTFEYNGRYGINLFSTLNSGELFSKNLRGEYASIPMKLTALSAYVNINR